MTSSVAGSAAGLGTSVGAASGLAVAAVVIGGLAVGAALGTALRKVFGEARAVRAEEAQVEGALILRRARARLSEELGRELTRVELAKLFDSYAANLVQLGFVRDPEHPLRWYRPRSRVERILG